MLKVAYCQYELKAFRNCARDAGEGRVDLSRARMPRQLAEQRSTRWTPRVGEPPQDHRDLRLDPGRGRRRRLADALHPPDRLSAALRLLRHGVRVPRRRLAHRRDLAGNCARGSGVRRVCVTGGEPLAQKACIELLRALCDAGFQVSLETSGAIDVGAVDPRVSRVVDLKTPDSGESARNRLENLALLTRARPAEDRALLARRLRVGTRALRALHAVAGHRRPARCCSRRAGASSSRASWRSGSWPIASTCGCRCSCTRSCGATSPGDERGRGTRSDADGSRRRRAGLGWPRFRDLPRDRARRGTSRATRSVSTMASATWPSSAPRSASPQRSAPASIAC